MKYQKQKAQTWQRDVSVLLAVLECALRGMVAPILAESEHHEEIAAEPAVAVVILILILILIIIIRIIIIITISIQFSYRFYARAEIDMCACVFVDTFCVQHIEYR